MLCSQVFGTRILFAARGWRLELDSLGLHLLQIFRLLCATEHSTKLFASPVLRIPRVLSAWSSQCWNSIAILALSSNAQDKRSNLLHFANFTKTCQQSNSYPGSNQFPNQTKRTRIVHCKENYYLLLDLICILQILALYVSGLFLKSWSLRMVPFMKDSINKVQIHFWGMFARWMAYFFGYHWILIAFNVLGHLCCKLFTIVRASSLRVAQLQFH